MIERFNAWHRQAECDGNPLALAISGFALVGFMASTYFLTLLVAAGTGAM